MATKKKKPKKRSLRARVKKTPVKSKSNPKRKTINKAKKIAIVKKGKEKQVGKVTHFYDKINVAVIKLFAPLALGDKIKIRGGEIEFDQKVDSMEFDHLKIKKAKKGDEIGLKIAKEAREGYKVFKI